MLNKTFRGLKIGGDQRPANQGKTTRHYLKNIKTKDPVFTGGLIIKKLEELKMITKINSIKVSERVFNILDDFLEWQNDNGSKLSAYLQTFYNCREQGYYLTVSDENLNDEARLQEHYFLYIYVCEARNSDDILVVIQTDYTGGMYSEKAYNGTNNFNNLKHFKYNEEHGTAEYIYQKIKEFFKL